MHVVYGGRSIVIILVIIVFNVISVSIEEVDEFVLDDVSVMMTRYGER